jgi:hypothetical protein
MWFVRAGLLIGVFGQVMATVLSPRTSGASSLPSAVAVLWAYLSQAFVSIWTGSSRAAAEVLSFGGFPILVAAALPVLAAAAYAIWRGTSEQRVMTIALVAGSAVCFGVSFSLNVASLWDYSAYSSTDWLTFFFFRYSVLPSILLSGVGFIAVSILHTRGMRILPWLVLAAALAVSVTQFVPETTVKSAWTPWFVELEAGRQACAQADPPLTYAIPVAPGRQWAAILSCETILK